MYIWIGVNVDGQMPSLKEKALLADREIGFKHSCFTLPQHISLKISFDVSTEIYDSVITDILAYYEGIEPFYIEPDKIQNCQNICWVLHRSCPEIEKIALDLNNMLKSRYGVPLHEYDLDFLFHTSLFMDDDFNKVSAAYERVKNEKLPERLKVNRFVIGTSENGALGTFKVVHEIVK